jgi:hypothetical protein
MSNATPNTKPKLLVILGAGSSVELGMPSVGEIDRLMMLRADEWTRDNRNIAPPNWPDFFRLVWENREAAKRTAEQAGTSLLGMMLQPNYERCLGDLQALMNGTLPTFGLIPANHTAELCKTAGLGGDNRNPPEEIKQWVYGAMGDLLGRLTHEFRERSRNSEPGRMLEVDRRDEFARYRGFFAALRERFDLGVYNLNHETVALTALDGIYLGFDRSSGCFEAAAVQSRQEWDFLYHLHGSVHFTFGGADGSAPSSACEGEIRWAANIPHQAWYQVTRPPRMASDGRWGVPSLLVAGGWKLDQLQMEPFQTFYSTLPQHAHEADAILIAGYGFGDEHVNSVLKNVLKAREGHRPPVMVLDFLDPEKRPLEGERRTGHEFVERTQSRWQSDVLTKLGMWDGGPKSGHDFQRAKRLDQPLPETEHGEPVRAEEYAVCFEDAYPVAVWFGGMLGKGMGNDEFEGWKTSLADWLLQHVPAR